MIPRTSRPARILFAGSALLLCLGIGWYVGMYGRQNTNRAKNQTPSVQNQSAGTVPESGQLMKTERASWGSMTYDVMHSCEGEVKNANSEAPYCIGKNTLRVRSPQGETTDLDIRNAVSADDAPVLIASNVVAQSSDRAVILISYAVDPCRTKGDCAPDMATNFVTYAYTAGAASPTYRALIHYPASGVAVWNSSGTKSVFIPNTCGAGGCGLQPIIGYDLEKDLDRPVTTVAAVGSEDVNADASDPTGQPLLRWLGVQWTDDSHFSAQIRQPDGSKEAVEGEF